MTSREGGDTERSPREVLPPDPATTLAEFTPALRQLRTWAGLTYRQLEARARELGKTLPSSTIATTLGRNTLPRESFVDTYTRACGLDHEQVRRWLDARARIAMGNEPQTAERIDVERIDSGEEVIAAPARNRASWHWRAPLIVIMIVGIGLVAALGLRALSFGNSAQTTSNTATTSGVTTVPGLDIAEVGSWMEIHPARTPTFCLAEGRDRTSLYTTAIAAQQPCGQADSPHIFVDPVGSDNAVQIQWHHPESGVGCLTVLNEGAGQDLLVPRDDCDDDHSDQMFKLEPIGSPDGKMKRFRIHPINTDNKCLGLRDQDTIAGTEIVQERCSGAPDQEFLINSVLPP